MNKQEKIVIEVNQDDIDNGKKYNGCDCPIALAIKRCGVSKMPVVSAWGIVLNCSKNERFIPPLAAMVFMSRFDAGLPVHPITFELEN